MQTIKPLYHTSHALNSGLFLRTRKLGQTHVLMVNAPHRNTHPVPVTNKSNISCQNNEENKVRILSKNLAVRVETEYYSDSVLQHPRPSILLIITLSVKFNMVRNCECLGCDSSLTGQVVNYRYNHLLFYKPKKNYFSNIFQHILPSSCTNLQELQNNQQHLSICVWIIFHCL